MTGDIRGWLPKEAFSADAVIAALAGIAGGWSDVYGFAGRAAAITAARVGERKAPFPVARCLHFRGAIAAAELSETGKRHLLEAALDADLSVEATTEHDCSVLDALVTEVVEDLIARLDQALASEGSQADTMRVHLSLSVAGNDLFSIEFPACAIVPMLKARLGAPRDVGLPVRNRVEALAPTRVIAEGLLGRAELAADDLKDLSIGDVLILDRAVHEPVELLLSTGQSVGCGKLSRSGSHASIQF